MPLTLYSMSLDAMVAVNLIEDSGLSTLMKINSSGFLFVKDEFIEETRSYSGPGPKMALTYDGNLHARFFIEVGIGIPPIPTPVGSMSFDTFDYYTPLVGLDGLNSGSNEWNNTTPLAEWSARIAFIGIKEFDTFTSYTISSSMYPSLAGSGSGDWSGVYDYYGRIGYKGIKFYDDMAQYTPSSPISGSSGSGSGIIWDGSGWDAPYDARTVWYGIKAYDDFTGYVAGTSISGSGSQPDVRYQDFTMPWDARTIVSTGSG